MSTGKMKVLVMINRSLKGLKSEKGLEKDVKIISKSDLKDLKLSFSRCPSRPASRCQSRCPSRSVIRWPSRFPRRSADKRKDKSATIFPDRSDNSLIEQSFKRE